MQENFFETFVEWINRMSYDELINSPEYKKLLDLNGRIGDKITAGLGGDDTLIEKYSDSYEEMNTYYCYFLCRKVAEAVIKIITINN